MPDYAAILETILPKLQERGVSYALIGGLAVSAHGCIRDTRDIDLLVRQVDLAAFDRVVAEVGYSLVQRTETMSFFDLLGPGLAPLDALHASSGTSLEILDRAIEAPIGGHGVVARIATVEDLIGLKIYAIDNNPKRRGKDWLDVSMLARRFRSTLDWDRVRAYFAAFDRESECDALRQEVGDG